jgi:DNA-binding response OmpR family regulator
VKILIVEDDDHTSNLLAVAFKAHRYLVDVAADGETALEIANLWDYDVIILDLQLPKLDGLSICRQLREQGKQSPNFSQTE